jgi:hypothetical protein
MRFSGLSPDGGLVEIIELPDHPFFVATQFHPELRSRPTAAHPLFRSFVRAAAERSPLDGPGNDRPGREHEAEASEQAVGAAR